jgi:hypothetical protein
MNLICILFLISYKYSMRIKYPYYIFIKTCFLNHDKNHAMNKKYINFFIKKEIQKQRNKKKTRVNLVNLSNLQPKS